MPLRRVQVVTDAADVLAAAERAVKDDLDLHEKGQKAMVSFVRAYKEHQCSYVFRLEQVLLPHVCLPVF